MSGPILDRMDIVLLVGNTAVPDLDRKGSRFRKLKTQTALARTHAIESWGEVPAQLAPAAVEKLLERNLSWRKALDQLQLTSLRARHKTVRVALSLSIWDGAREPQAAHFMEASCYRPERFGLCE
jgi:predicted ATPase with chaperone activity